jgi:hypothetical protein
MVMTRSLALVLLFATLAVAACAADPEEPPSSPRSGIEVVVVFGPQCPVVVAESPCPDAPWQGTVRVSSLGDDDVEARTDASGRARITLPAGTYTVAAILDEGGVGSSKAEAVTVTDGSFVNVRLTVDSGIR